MRWHPFRKPQPVVVGTTADDYTVAVTPAFHAQMVAHLPGDPLLRDPEWWLVIREIKGARKRIQVQPPLPDIAEDIVLLCREGHYCVTRFQPSPSPDKPAHYQLAENWRELEPEARRNWQFEHEPYHEGGMLMASVAVQRKTRFGPDASPTWKRGWATPSQRRTSA